MFVAGASRKGPSLVALAAFEATLTLSVFPAAGASVSWTDSSGDWETATNWSSNPSLPGQADDAYIVNGGTATITQAGDVCKSLSLGSTAGSGFIQMTSGHLSAVLEEHIGYSGTGYFRQSGGTNMPDGILLGENVGSTGTYWLSGSGVLAAPTAEIVGESGAGTFTQTGGTNYPSSLYLGDNTGSSGTYSLSASGFLQANEEYVGNSGQGIFTQSGGTNTVALTFSLHAAGTYNLTGGALLVPGIQGSGTFDLGGGSLVAKAAFSASQAMTLTGSGGNGNIDTGVYAVTLSGALSGSGGLNKLGAGTLTLAGSNTYSGGTKVNAGTLKLGTAASLPSGMAASISGSLDVSTFAANVSVLTGAGTVNHSGTGSATLTVGSGDASSSFAGTIENTSGTLALLKTGSGQLILNGTDTYRGGTTVVGGTLILTNSKAIADGTRLTVGDPALFLAAVVPSPMANGASASPIVSSTSVPVPEPGTLVLLVVGVAMLAMYFKHR